MIKQNGQGTKKIYIWSILFLSVIYAFTTFLSYNAILLCLIYFVMALPFYKQLDKLAALCLVVATLQDYFAGATAGIWSIYTIFMVIAIVNICYCKRITKKNIVLFLIMVIVIYASYTHSPFYYTNGALSLCYCVVMCVIVLFTVRFNADTLTAYLPMLAAVVVVMYMANVIIKGSFDSLSMTVAQEINHNAFGRSLAQLSTILTAKVLLDKNRKRIYVVLWVLSVLMTLLTGSRNSFLAFAVAAVFIYVYKQKANGKIFSGLFKFGIVALCMFALASAILPEFGFNITRFNYIELISGGGTNRMALWLLLIPEIVSKYMLFGYGPGTYCSAQIVYPLIGRAYTSTHNTFLEAWGELGIFGLVTFVLIFVNAFRKILKKTKYDMNYLVITALFVATFVNGLGESMFGGMNLWILLGFCYADMTLKQDNLDKIAEQL